MSEYINEDLEAGHHDGLCPLPVESLRFFKAGPDSEGAFRGLSLPKLMRTAMKPQATSVLLMVEGFSETSDLSI